MIEQKIKNLDITNQLKFKYIFKKDKKKIKWLYKNINFNKILNSIYYNVLGWMGHSVHI